MGQGHCVTTGSFSRLKRAWIIFIIPVIDTIAYWIDIRVITTAFKAEKTLTKDTVPVDVDAVLFWKVIDPKKAALEVADFESAIGWACQTALRDMIGKTMLSDLLEGRSKISNELQIIIDERTEPWGIKVISVEVKDVLIPPALEDAMSMQAQAERERQARVILGDSERQVAEKFGEAAKTYIDNPVALHLRAMNMLYEGLKENSTIVIVPSSAIETMQLGGLAGMTALTMELDQKQQINEKKRIKNKTPFFILRVPMLSQLHQKQVQLALQLVVHLLTQLLQHLSQRSLQVSQPRPDWPSGGVTLLAF